MDHPATRASQMDAVEELVDRGEDFVNAALLDQFGRYLIVQQSLPREKPQPRIVRLVNVGQLVDDELELQKLLLGAGVRQRFAFVPAGNGLRAHVQDIGHY